jgi:thiamine biosynthesis protein ThiS
MRVTVNGKPEDVAEGSTVKSLLEMKGISPNVVACELNLKILRRATLGQEMLKDGDVLEIIQMIGGG